MEHPERKIEEPGKMAGEQNLELIAVAGSYACYEFFVRIAGGVLKERVL
jgi:hypothetical protein